MRPTWEVRYSACEKRKAWGVFNHTIDSAGRSYQILKGSWRVRWQKLQEEFLARAVGSKSLGCVLQRESASLPLPISHNVAVKQEIVEFKGSNVVFARTSTAQFDLIGEALDRGGERDEVPDYLFWGPDISDSDLRDWSRSLLIASGAAGIVDVPEWATGSELKTLPLPDHGSVCLLQHNHLYLYVPADEETIPAALREIATKYRLILPNPPPELTGEWKELCHLIETS